MFIVLLTFSDNKKDAKEHMEGHKRWLQTGFDEGVFLVAGSLQPNMGGGIVAHNTTRDDLEKKVAEDPFVRAKVVEAKILEISASKADPRLEFLL